MSSVGRRIEELSPQKRALLARRLLSKAEPTEAGTSIPRLGRREACPLSYAQQRMWFLHQLEPSSTAYNILTAIRLRGVIDVAVLEKSLCEIVGRHEALRTRFLVKEGEARQYVDPPAPVPLPVEDLGDLPEEERSAEAERLMRAEGRRPFDLEQGPLVRARLVRIAEDHHVFLMTIHHIVCDGFSIPVMLRDLDALYQAFLHERPSPLPELPIQYADFAIWQQQWLQEETPARELAYWRKQLGGDLPLLELPTDHPRPHVQSYRGAFHTRQLPVQLSDALKALAREEGATLFMVLLSAFQLLLHRCTGQEEIVLGTPISGRNRVELEGLIGCFLNTLVLRSNLSGDPTFRELLKRVRGVALDAYAHQDVPFEKLLEELQPQRDTSRPPLFQVLFNMHNFNAEFDRLLGVRCEILTCEDETSKFDLTLYVDERDAGVRWKVVYNADLFSSERITELLAQLERLAEQIVASPDRPIGSYDLITPEARRLLPDPTAALPEPEHTPVTDTFAARALEDPERVAVRQDDRSWSYTDLAGAARGLAGMLLAQGLERGDVVAVCGDRSFGLIAALVGVFSSGGVLLALDPRLPEPRQRLMLQEAGAKRLLYVGPPRSEDQWMWRAMLVTGVEPKTGQPEAGDPGVPDGVRLPDLEPGDAAYIFFTSGTTGVPKGVLGTQLGLAHFLDWQRRTFAVEPRDRVAQLTGLSFDVVLRDVFLPLTSGATLCLPTPDDALLPRQALSWLEREGISLLHVVPTLAQSWLADVPPNVSLRTLRCAFFAGEPLTDTLVQQWREAFPEAGEVVNLYGPTETTLVKCYHRVSDPPRHGIQPVGRPLPQTQALVLTEDDRLCGIGEPAEIVLRTPARTLGYINAPEEMERRFVANPFRKDPRDLLYRTGDRGRYGADGVVEILGRLDDQVKIRGVRIEPDEISAVLAKHPEVHQSVVIAREDAPGDRRLVAYLVPTRGQQPTASELRRFARLQLPEYMVPSAFVTLDAVPRTPNGKVDRRALPAPDRGEADAGTGYVAPRTPIEDLTALIWAEVLGVDRVGVHDSFFDLGGHSLLATQVISRLQLECQVELPIRSLFDRPTVAELAEQIVAARLETPDEEIRAVVSAPRSGDLPLSFSEERMWFLHQLDERGAAYNVANAVRLMGPLDLEVLADAVNAIVERHEILRTTFRSVDGRPVREVAPSARLELASIDLEASSEPDRQREIQRLATEQAQQPFVLSQLPLARVAVLRASDTDHVFLLVMHHIISDAWSVGIFMQELLSIYGDLSHNRPVSLPALQIQYADFASWQREWVKRSALDRDLAYWTECLAGAPLVLDLPTDRPRPARQTSRGARESLALPEELDEALNALSHREGVTAFMTFFTAFNALLYRLTGREDIVVGTPVANRHWLAVERLIGTLINTLVLRTDLSGNPTLRELLGRVREVALEAYSHQNLPFEQLVETLQPERDLSRSPVFQVMFTHQRVPIELPSPPELEVSYLQVDRRAAQLDMTMSLREMPGEGRQIGVEYNRDLFDRETIVRLLAHMQTLLEGLVRDPDQRLEEVETLPDAEREQLLTGWNDTARAFPAERCLHELFEAQAQRTPGAIAVVFGDQELSYRALNERANRLAHHLRSLGVGPEVLVGICLERSTNMIVGLLGILKAGGAYVPLDPSYPTARLELVVEDAGLTLLVTQEKLREKLPSYRGPVVCLDAEAEAWMDGTPLVGNPRVDELGSSNLAYVIYTSGSTGRPKGVAIPHRALVNFLTSMQREPGLDPSDVLLSVTTFSFDIAGLEFYLPLLVGARVILVDRDVTLDADRLIEALGRSGATVMQATPAAFRMLLDAGWRGCERLKVLCGGEALPQDLARRLVDCCGALWNMYGPTETTIWSTLHRIDPGDRPLIGRPIANTQIYLLDPQQRLVPVGAVGELHIGGEGLARGYHGRPDLTKEKFVPNPFDDDPDSRIYKTGDLARYLPDGRIECLGRVDDQVKLRGFRIELGEIESSLREHAAVEEAVVVLREDVPGDERLVAYAVLQCVSEQESAGSAGRLRDFLKDRLPPYMVPSAFVFLDALPLTPNGKINRRALPAPDTGGRETETFVAPRTPLESQLATVWEKVLGQAPIGTRDDFFEIGGHSLLAVRLLSEIEGVTGRTLPVATIFEAPTIEGLAAILECRHEDGASPSWPVLVPLQASGSKPPFFFVAGIENHFGDRLGPDQPVYRVQVQDLDREQFFTSVEEMATNCLENIRALQPEGPYFLGGYCFGGVVAFEIAQQLHRQGQKVALLVMLDAYAPGSLRSRKVKRLAHRIRLRAGFYAKQARDLGPRSLIRRLLRDARKTSRQAMWRMRWRLDSKLLPTARYLRDPRAANYAARRRYVASAYAGHITLFPCAERPPWTQIDPQNGWGDLAKEGVEIHPMPGHHSGMCREPVVHQLVETLDACLVEAQKRWPGDARPEGGS